MTQTQFISSLALVTVLFFAWELWPQDKAPNAGGITAVTTQIGAATTSTSVTLSLANAGSRVLATTTNALGNGSSNTRVYAEICNPNATLTYIRLDNDKMASPTSGIPIAAAAGYDACYEITDRNLYQGSVTASSSAANVLLVTEYVQ